MERGVDFSEDVSTVKRHLFTEAARKGVDVTIRVLQGDRLLFQVYGSGEPSIPRLPDLTDARKKHPWNKWLDGEEHFIPVTGKDLNDNAQRSLRAYVYKQAKVRGLKVRVSIHEGGIKVRAYKSVKEDDGAED